MKKISVMVPTYNEEENVVPLSEAIIGQLDKLPEYDYELVFIDNDSKDSTREKLEMLCKGNPKIKAIFNAKNFGQFNSPFYGMLQTTGDCTITMCADFQDPVEMIPKFIHEWEQGYKIVSAIKTTSKENFSITYSCCFIFFESSSLICIVYICVCIYCAVADLNIVFVNSCNNTSNIVCAICFCCVNIFVK